MKAALIERFEAASEGIVESAFEETVESLSEGIAENDFVEPLRSGFQRRSLKALSKGRLKDLRRVR